jgi:hypothetical protein
MGDYILKKMQDIINDTALNEKPVEFTQKLIDLKKKLDFMVEQCFLNDVLF